MISPYFGGSSLYFPIFEKISLFGISEFPYISYTSLYFEYQISLLNSKNSLLCLIILPILKRKSPYLSSQMYHMYGNRILKFGTKLGYEKLKGVIENHALLLIISFIYPFFFFSNKKSVSDFPSSILTRVFKFCIHPESV